MPKNRCNPIPLAINDSLEILYAIEADLAAETYFEDYVDLDGDLDIAPGTDGRLSPENLASWELLSAIHSDIVPILNDRRELTLQCFRGVDDFYIPDDPTLNLKDFHLAMMAAAAEEEAATVPSETTFDDFIPEAISMPIEA